MLGRITAKGWLGMKISISAHLSALFVWPWCQMEGKLKESGGYLGWHEQLLTEKQDLVVTIATLVLPTLVRLSVYSLFVQSSSWWKKKCLAEVSVLTVTIWRTPNSFLQFSKCRNISLLWWIKITRIVQMLLFLVGKQCLLKSLLNILYISIKMKYLEFLLMVETMAPITLCQHSQKIAKCCLHYLFSCFCSDVRIIYSWFPKQFTGTCGSLSRHAA